MPDRADVLVVLGCRHGPKGALRGAVLARVERALEAWRGGLAPGFIVSGGRRWHGLTEAHAMRGFLAEAGVPSANVLCDHCSLSTAENAYYSVRLAREHKFRRLLIVTQDWHLPRALRAFRRAGASEASGLAAPSPWVPFTERAHRHIREACAGVLDHWAVWGADRA
jgi:uncharacterized SAM-binding protein YcdF (DUF218 family)